MKKLNGALSALALALSACGPWVSGNGDVYDEARWVEPFDMVHVDDGLDAEIWVGPSHSVSVLADSNLQPVVHTEVLGRTLRIWADATIVSGTAEIRVTVPGLAAITVSDGAVATARGVSSTMLDLELSGGSELVVSGEVGDLTVHASGGSEAYASGLAAWNAYVVASGGSLVEVTASNTLEVDASGGSEVVACGHPTRIYPNLSGDSSLTLE